MLRIKVIVLMLLSSCSYDNICPVQKINQQLIIENQKIKEILKQEWTQETIEQIVEEMDVIESLEIEKLNLRCK